MSGKTLEQLKQQHLALGNRIKKMQASEKTRERKRETRRKILVGSYYLDQAKQQGTQQNLIDLMHTYLTRPSDRALFDLPSLPTQTDTPHETENTETD